MEFRKKKKPAKQFTIKSKPGLMAQTALSDELEEMGQSSERKAGHPHVVHPMRTQLMFREH